MTLDGGIETAAILGMKRANRQHTPAFGHVQKHCTALLIMRALRQQHALSGIGAVSF